MTQLLRIYINLGFSGLWTFAIYLGCFVGPTLSGILVNYFQYKMVTMVYFVTYIALVLANTCELTYLKIVDQPMPKSGYKNF